MGDQNQKSALSRLSVAIGPALALIPNVEGALLGIPNVGGVLSATWSEWNTSRRFSRIEQTMEQILKKLGSNPILNSWAENNTGMQTLELVLREAQIEHCAKKRERFANLLVSSWISENPQVETFDETMLFIRATSQFTDSHIAVLQSLHDAGITASVSFDDIASFVSVENATPDEQNEAALIVLDDLCSRFAFTKRAWDLNKSKEKGGVLSTENLSPEGIARNCFHAITPRGNRYFEYVIRGPAA